MFEPAFAFWPPPRFLGDSPDGLSAWIVERDTIEDRRVEQSQSRSDVIKQIVDAHHDRHAQIIDPRR